MKHRTAWAGLTLIEVLVSITILAVVSVAIVSAFGGMVAINRTAEADLGAGADARAVVEGIRGWAGDRTVFDGLDEPSLTSFISAIPEYGSCDVQQVEVDSPVVGVRRVSLLCQVDGGSAPVPLVFDIARPSS